jgi:predicted ATPase/DNA-binding CsgD family transcriptional regulator
MTGSVPPDTGVFVGRDAELAQLHSLHRGARLLTLLGPAGVGKTRLGRRLAAQATGMYSDGVWFVDLAGVGDAAIVPFAVAGILDVRLEAGRSVADALVAHLRRREVLLVLDTCEHVLDACADLGRTLCDACPRVHLVAISREPMNTSGDTIWRAPPLGIPPATANRAEVARAYAVRLLVHRARQHDAHFAVTRSNSAHLREVCRSVGGLPLALELVAARLSSSAKPPPLPLEAEGEHVLTRTLDWAYRLLKRSDQLLLRRLSVFSGGWDAASARDVCMDDTTVEERLQRLAAASLIQRQPGPGGPRYRMLDSLREYARGRLDAAGEADVFMRRFVAHMRAVAERAAPEVLDAEHAARLETDIDNLRGALSLALRRGYAEDGLRLALAACSLWYFRALYAEGCQWLERALEIGVDCEPGLRARASAWLGQLLQFQGEYASAARWLNLAAKRYLSAGDPLGSAFVVGMLGQLTLVRGNLARARVLCADAAERLAAAGHPTHVASLLQLAIIEIELGHPERAAAIVKRCREATDETGPLAAWSRLLEGRVAAARGDFVGAQRSLENALRAMRRLHERTAVITALIELGDVQVQLRPAAGVAHAPLLEALELARAAGERMQLARAMEGLAASLAPDRPTYAVRLLSTAAGLRKRIGARRWPSDERRVAAWLPAAQQRLGADYPIVWSQGRSMELEEALKLTSELSKETPTNEDRVRPAFTAREQQIARLLSRAWTNQQIASELSIRPATARTHVEHMMTKLGIHTRAELVLWASQQMSRGAAFKLRRDW